MINASEFLTLLAEKGVSFFAGVPDSLLKGLITAIEKEKKRSHFIAANEGAALALAAGYHMATGRLPVVYLQNSGLGNLVNPLTSLTDKKMYGIPALLIIGWRGEPGLKDEPQHSVMGTITPALLNLLHIPFIVLKKGGDREWRISVTEAVDACRKENRPVALLVEADVFSEDEIKMKNSYELSSEDAIQCLYDSLSPTDIVVCTTGKIGRVFHKINSSQKKITSYFLNVGSMGHALSLATGMAMSQNRRVVLFDGDGALLMHTGALALTASLRLRNLVYVLLNNGAHQSVGGQSTLGFSVDFCAIAKGFGVEKTALVENAENLEIIAESLGTLHFIEVRINTKTDTVLPRPEEKPEEAKRIFMKSLNLPA